MYGMPGEHCLILYLRLRSSPTWLLNHADCLFQMEKLTIQMRDYQDQAEMLQAASSNVTLLRQELSSEQRARRDAEGRVAVLETQLAQVSKKRGYSPTSCLAPVIPFHTSHTAIHHWT